MNEIVRITSCRVCSLHWHGHDVTTLVVALAFLAGAATCVVLNQTVCRWTLAGIDWRVQVLVVFACAMVVTAGVLVGVVALLIWGQR